MRHSIFVVVSFLLSAAASNAADAPAIQRPSENIAINRPYTLWPAPHYKYCTDPGDRVQLTDGEYSRGYFWTQKSTVGWNPTSPVVITIDLGKIQPVRGASFNTAAGVAGVQWPVSIDLLVSDDGKSFHHAGDLIALSQKNGAVPMGKYAVHRYWTGDFHAHGRYVSFVVSPITYCFVDEIEVYRGENSWVSEAQPGRAYPDPVSFHKQTSVRRAVAQRIGNDIEAIRKLIEQVKPSFATEAIAELDRLATQIPALPDPSADFKAVLPLNDLHRQVLAVRERVMRVQLKNVASPIFTTRSYDPLGYLATPDAGTATKSLEIAMMANETRAATFAIALSSGQVGVRIEDLPGGANPAWIKVHAVQWTDTRAGEPVADALPLAKLENGEYRVSHAAGLLQEVWLSFHPTDVPAGVHRGAIVLSGILGAEKIRIPLTVEIAPIRFPDRPTLHLGGWDYTDADSRYEITAANRDAVIAHLRERYVDSPWGTSAVLPHGKHDATGKMIEAPDTARFETWIGRWPNAGQYCVFASVPAKFEKFEMGSPEFATAVGEWIRFWADHATKRGIEPKKLAVLLVDEPHAPEQDATILAWAKAIRAANTGVILFEDPTHADPYKANQAMLAACDVLCPNRPMYLAGEACRKYYSTDRPKSAALAFYSCSGPVRSLDPYSYHRLQAWTCFEQGAGGMYFWAFGDGGGGSSWNEYAAARHAYCPSFLDATNVTTSKHMEAICEGVEDYEYLVMLKEAIRKAKARGSKGAEVDAAEKLLIEGPRRVLNAEGVNELTWPAAKDRSIADQVRVEVLRALAKLNQ